MKKGDNLRKRILKAGLKLWPNVTVCNVARELGITHPNVSYYFKGKLKDAVIKHALEIGDSKIIAQLILNDDKAVRMMPEKIRQQYMKAAIA